MTRSVPKKLQAIEFPPMWIFHSFLQIEKSLQLKKTFWKITKNNIFAIFIVLNWEFLSDFQTLTLFENVSFCFFNLGIFRQFLFTLKLTCLVTLFDHKLWSFFGIFNMNFFTLKCKRSSLRSQCWMRLFLWFWNTVYTVQFKSKKLVPVCQCASKRLIGQISLICSSSMQ